MTILWVAGGLGLAALAVFAYCLVIFADDEQIDKPGL